jgi:uncharacterized Fe-S center protein
MSSKVLFTSVEYDKYDASVTLPAKFNRMLDRMGLEKVVKDKLTVIKMHLGRGIGYTTIHPLFVKILVDKLKEYGARVFISDQVTEGARVRGYTEEYLGVPITPVCGVTSKYFYEKYADFKSLKNVDVGGHIYDADVMIDLSHVKGHGACGYGGACKNIAMVCVTDRTRQQIHGLEGGLEWDEDLCTHCELCINSCNHSANEFIENKYTVNYHHCTLCTHCVKVCPVGAIHMTDDQYQDFQTGMAVCTEQVLKTFAPGHVFYINFLTNITALCDCWGLSTPALVPDIGVMASQDIVAVERACIDAIKFENLLLSGVPKGMELGTEGHLFQRLHGKDPHVQLNELEKRGLGTQEYTIEETF